MERFPDELLLEIFSHLTPRDLVLCSAVCRRWLYLSRDKSLWQDIDLSSSTISLRCLGKLLKSKNAHTLNLENSRIEDPRSWTHLFSPNELRRINLSNADISSRSLGHLLKSTSSLVYLNLHRCDINHTAHKAIVANAHLRELDLSHCRKLPSALYRALFKGCQALEELDLTKTQKWYRHLRCFRSKTLQRLSVSSCDLEYREIKQIVMQCPRLTHLDISFNYVGPLGVNKLKKSFPNLMLFSDDESEFDEHESDYDADDDWWDTNAEGSYDQDSYESESY